MIELRMEPLEKVQVPWGHTAGQLLLAHAKLTGQTATDLAINTAMSTQISLTCVLTPGMVVKIDRMKCLARIPCQIHLEDDRKRVPILIKDTREVLLWQQHGWVAIDKMSFYMQMAGNSYPGGFLPPRFFFSVQRLHGFCQVVQQVCPCRKLIDKLPCMSVR